MIPRMLQKPRPQAEPAPNPVHRGDFGDILYVNFENKTELFREAVELNIEMRLRSLDRYLASIAVENQIDCIESMAEATMPNCLSDAANSILMNWALLEAPELATDLYRNEIGSVRLLWDREVA